MDFTVLIPAAGKSVRYGTGNSKLGERLGAHTVLERAIGAFVQRQDVAAIIIAAGDIGLARTQMGPHASDARVRLVQGGACRAESVRAALEASSGTPFVAVHDGARPGVSQALIRRVFAAAREHGAAGPALAVELTIKEANGPLPTVVGRTVPRSTLWAMQTPQAMRRSDLVAAFERCPIPLAEVTDDLQLLELAGFSAVLVEGEAGNIKVTRPMDLSLLGA